MEDPAEVNTAIKGAREAEGATDFDRRRIQNLAKLYACGRAVIERLPFQLSQTEEHREKIGPGYWLYVESGGSSLATFTPKGARENHANHYNFPLPTGLVFPGEFEEAVIRIPTGIAAGLMNIWVARFPVPLPRVTQNFILDATGAPITAANPLPVSTISAAALAPLVMAAAVGVVPGAADTLLLAANPARRALWVGMAGVTAASSASFSFNGAAAALNAGITLYTTAAGIGAPMTRVFIAPEPAVLGEVRVIGSAAGVRASAQEAT